MPDEVVLANLETKVPARLGWMRSIAAFGARTRRHPDQAAHPEVLTLIGPQGGTIEDVKGVYDYFATRQIDPGHHPDHLRRDPAGLQRLRDGGVVGRMVALY